MSFVEEEPFPQEGIDIDVEIEDGTLFFTYCHDCKKVLYCATRDNPVTNLVARETMHDHGEFYIFHQILIIKNTH